MLPLAVPDRKAGVDARSDRKPSSSSWTAQAAEAELRVDRRERPGNRRALCPAGGHPARTGAGGGPDAVVVGRGHQRAPTRSLQAAHRRRARVLERQQTLRALVSLVV